MHDNGMVHLDIKPDNLLFAKENMKDFNDMVIKISDLGLARITKLKRDSDLEEGDSRYLAREVLNYHKQYDLRKADIFSLGMTIYEVLTLLDLPNSGEQWMNIREYGICLESMMSLQDYNSQLLRIVSSMISPQPNARPSAQQIL